MRTPLKTLTPVMALTLVLTISAGAFAMPIYAAATPATPATPASPAAPAAPATPITKGIVVETMDSGGYTYLHIENNGQKRWVAIPKTSIKVGQQVEIAPGVEMGQYTSKSLGRTFDSIYFSRGLAGKPLELPHALPEAGKMSMPAATKSPAPGHGMPAPEKKPMPPAATITGKVAETFDAGGYTYVAVEQDGQSTWVASPPVKVTVGQNVSFKSGFVMRNFTSGSLGRSFDSIVFTSGLETLPPPPAAPTPGK